MQLNGTGTATAAAPAAAPAKSRGKHALTAGRPAAAAAAAVPLTAARAELTVHPTALELAADKGDLDIIRELYGSRSKTLINALLAYDGFFLWWMSRG